MKNRYATCFAALLISILSLGVTTGCSEGIRAVSSVSFGLGWFIRNITASSTTEEVCYQNGVLIDCSELPEDLGQ